MTKGNTRLTIQGTWEVRRRIKVPGMAHQYDTQTIIGHLSGLPGVRGASADIGNHRVTVIYDATQTNYLEVLEALEKIGFPTTDGPWARFKTNLYQYLDSNSRENANAPAAPCCSNPKGITPPKR